jgi:hypothetical protein
MEAFSIVKLFLIHFHIAACKVSLTNPFEKLEKHILRHQKNEVMAMAIRMHNFILL